MSPTTPEGLLHDIYEHLTPPDTLGSELAAVGALSIYRPRDARNTVALSLETLHSALSYASAALKRKETPRLGAPPQLSRLAKADLAFAQNFISLFSGITRMRYGRCPDERDSLDWVLAQVDEHTRELEAWVMHGRRLAKSRLRRMQVTAPQWLKRMVTLGGRLTSQLFNLRFDYKATLVYDDWDVQLLPACNECDDCGRIGVLPSNAESPHAGACILCLNDHDQLNIGDESV